MNTIDDYDYELPATLIAQQPMANRADARLLLVHRADQQLDHFHVRDLVEILRPNDLLVLNETQVIPARLVGRRTATGGRWQGLFLERDSHGLWRILGKTRGKLQVGETITLDDMAGQPHTALELVHQLPHGQWVASPHSDLSMLDLLNQVGRVPLPHYIRHGEMLPGDREHYQTVYAKTPGSVAAPTAGLHFTRDLLQQLRNEGVGTAFVTLHVGMGTFRPIMTDQLDQHVMHSEWCELPESTVQSIASTKAAGGRVIAVGTTSVRVLESAALDGPPLAPWSGYTDLFIRPPFHFRVIDGLITNFHLPKSTLLVLVRTFGGDALIRRAYEAAVEERYRFFSYGDAMLIV